MIYSENIKKPSKTDRILALAASAGLSIALAKFRSQSLEIEIQETQEKIKIPRAALEILAEVLEATSKGKPVTVVPIDTEMTTQAAAELLGCSRPHLVKLLEEGEIPFTKIGKHRRVKFEDVMAYRKRMKERQKELIIKIMQADEESGLYDT